MSLIGAYQEIQKLDISQVNEAVRLIVEHNLPREAIPTEFLNSADVWSALLENMPLTAMIRNLGKMSSVGVLDSMSEGAKKIINTITNEDLLQKARIHPMAVLDALKVYNLGRGVKGSLTWYPNQQIVDALDSAFYKSFKFVKPTGKNLLLAVDCSGSMTSSISGSSVLSCRDAAAALALVTANVERNYEVVGFSSGAGWSAPAKRYAYGSASGLKELKISPSMRLDAVANVMAKLDWGGTDASLPAQYAMATKKKIDGFITITDNETWAGVMQPSEALVRYRQQSGCDAKQVVVGMSASNFSIADPNDVGQMDVVGFDSACPAVIADFFRG
ncbi:MAG: TROVE domain-containing protein [Richelia sp. RM2_1_2]|nr:TROVE domain-containing protein [Richelia sp. RM2_1_2]